MSTLGRYLKNRRTALAEKHSGFSIRSVAKHIGIHHSYLSRLERGEYAPLTEERIRALANLFGDDPELLIAIGGRLTEHTTNLISANTDQFLHFIASMEEQAEYSKSESLKRISHRKEELETLNRLLRDEIRKNQDLQNKVREQEEIYRTILSNLNDVSVILFDNELRILWSNTSLSENQNVCIQNSKSVSNQENFECASYSTVLSALRTKSIQNGTYQSSNSKHWLLRSVPIVDADKNIVRIVHIQFEVSELMQAKKNLEASEELLKLAIAGSREIIWDYDILTDIVNYEDSGFTMLGYSKNDMASTRSEWVKLIHKEDVNKVKNLIESHFKCETEFYNCEYRILCKNREYKWILSRGMVVKRDLLNRPLRMIGTHTDITDKKIIENKTKMNEIFLETLLTSIQEGITVISPDLKICYANRSLESIHKNYGPLVGRKCHEVYHQSDKPCEKCPTLRALNSGEKHFEIIEMRKFSSIEWIGLHAYPIKDNITGEITGVVEVAQNITELQNIKRSKILLSSIVENSQMNCVIKDLDLRIIAANKFCVHALGKSSADEIIGKTDAEIFDLDLNREAVARCMRDDLKAQTLSPGEFVDREETIIFPDGKIRIFHTHKFPIFDDNGAVISTANISNDITDKIHLQTVCANIENKYKDIIELAPIGICTANSKHQYLSMNSKYAFLYGYSSSEEMMSHRSNSLENFALQMDKDNFIKLLEKEKIVTRFECQTLRKDGSIFWTTRTIRAVYDESKKLEYYEAFVEEVHGKKNF
jgi:PAS domain S-box-containing protein